MRIAFITGITGQDGSYLAEFLLEKGYEVWGMVRRSSLINTHRIDHIYTKLNLRYGDLTDQGSIIRILEEIKTRNPEVIEFYNLGAMSHVKVSYEEPEYCANANGLGTLRCLESILFTNIEKYTKFFQASTSEMFGLVQEYPQNEKTPFYPRSPYGVSKLFGYWIVKNYRESYNLFASNGLTFNHESPRRGETFVTRKIIIGIANILKKKQKCIYLGNLDAKRDWMHAKDAIRGMWLMMQQDHPDDFVLASGNVCSVREFVEKAFKCVNIDIKWRNSGIDEEGYCGENILIRVDPKYFRLSEVELLCGDYSKAKKVLDWEPRISLDALIEEMVNVEIKK